MIKFLRLLIEIQMPKIIHFRDNCIGCNSCVEHAPDYWDIEEDGKSTLARATYKDGIGILDICDVEVPKNLLACHDCPVHIIHLQDDKGKDIR